MDNNYQIIKSIKEFPIDVLGLSRRSYNCLRRSEIRTLEDLRELLKSGSINELRNIGPKLEDEIIHKFNTYIKKNPLEENVDTDNKKETVLPRTHNNLSLRQEYCKLPLSCLNLRASTIKQLNKLGFHDLNDIYSLLSLDNQDFSRFGKLEINLFKLVKYELSSFLEKLPASTYLIDVNIPNPSSTKCESDTKIVIKLSESVLSWLNSIGNERSKSMLEMHFGLKGEPLTLEEISKLYNITRERVRQIENSSLKMLRRSNYVRVIDEVSNQIENAIASFDGVCSTEDIKQSTSFCPEEIRIQGLLELFAKITKIISRLKNSQVWTNNPELVLLIQKETRLLVSQRDLTSLDLLLSNLRQMFSTMPDEFILACIRTTPAIKKNKDGEYFIKRRQQNNVNMVINALREIGESAHFREITERINKSLPTEEKVDSNNVHALLLRYPKTFVYVAQGTYGLKETGLEKAEYFIDILQTVLRKFNYPLTIQEAHKRVCDIRDCKESTIIMLLSLNDRFRFFGKNLYGLAEWSDDKIFEDNFRNNRLIDSIIDDDVLNRRKPKNSISSTLDTIDELFQ